VAEVTSGRNGTYTPTGARFSIAALKKELKTCTDEKRREQIERQLAPGSQLREYAARDRLSPVEEADEFADLGNVVDVA
jgi:hypothetical protein